MERIFSTQRLRLMKHSQTLQKLFANQKALPIICSHRGGKENVPENSMASFKQSAANGIHCMENDIQLTRDDKIVIIHDSTVNRTTNSKGAVRELSLSELQTLDAGTWFNPSFKNERIPTLEEFLGVCKGVPLIEIKKYERYSEKLEVVLLETLKIYNRLYSSIIHSFDLDVLERLHKLDKNLNLGYLIEEPTIEIPKWVKGIHPEKDLLNEENLLEWRSKKLWVASWTYTNVSQFSNSKILPDIIITDIPIEAKNYFEANPTKSS